MRRFDLVVWDWDGTIADSIGAVADAIIGAATDLDLPVPTVHQARWVIGLGLLDAIHHAVPAIRREQVPAFNERYRVHYPQNPKTPLHSTYYTNKYNRNGNMHRQINEC
jgi:phosphoglycolate phosphatase